MTLLSGAVKQRAQYLVGGFGAAAAFFALYGPVAGIPSSQLSLIFIPLTFVALLLGGASSPHRLVLLPLVSAALIGFFAIAQASPEQFSFLLDRSQWHFREEHYVDAKLLMFLISFVPQMAALLMIACARDSRKATVGVLFALATIASLVALRVLIEDGSALIATDYMTAFNVFLSPGFSLVSYGLVLTTGGIAALYFRAGWIFAGVFLFLTALLSRRADVFALTFCLLATACYLWRIRGRQSAMKPIYSVLIALALIIPLHNGHNIAYFAATKQAYEARKDMAQEALTVESVDQGTDQTTTDKAASDKATPAVEAPTSNPFFGYGLGQYQKVTGSSFEYPHNIFLEILIELGAIPAALYLVMILSPLGMAAYQALRGRLDGPTMYLAMCLAIAVAISFKAGEIGELGRTALLAGLTILAATHQRQKVTHQSPDFIRQEQPSMGR